MIIFNAVLKNFNKVTVSVDDFSQFRSYKFEIKNGNSKLSIEKYSVVDNNVTLFLKEEVNIKSECYISHENLHKKILFHPLFSTKDFDNRFYHDLALGAIYNHEYTIFRIWSPTASNISLLLYSNGEPSIEEDKKVINMKESNGLWSVLVKGDLNGYYYNYEVEVYNKVNEVVDPYAKSVSINGLRGFIVDLSKTNPHGWYKDTGPSLENYTDAIIYETSIRDISIYHESGVAHKGKFLALTEDSTFSSNNLPTCLDHIKDLGITHLQLMPIFDFSYISVDEKQPYKYNWGYDPQNYNVPEGSYSTNPYDPICRIYELKKLIYHLHQNNIAVNMDVVYNHVFDAANSNFEKIFPEYYFRYLQNGALSNGSGCGNDTASEHSMMRKFIIDSVLYWCKEYHIDGFRFDLMGLQDIDTMNSLRKKLSEFKKNVMIYGEGWNLNTCLDESQKATYNNSKKLPGIAFFNDRIRDCIKGDVFNAEEKGFATGKSHSSKELIKLICCDFLAPSQSVNYISCHDNLTLWDKIDSSCKYESFDTKKRMAKLCAAIILTSPGIPFIYSGEEFCRTKYGEHNSYNKPDNINWVDWARKAEFIDVFNYYKNLISIRKNHPAFRIDTADKIKEHLVILDYYPDNTIGFILKDYANNDSWKDILVIFNANKKDVIIDLPEGRWYVALKDNTDIKKKISYEDTIVIPRISTCILFKM
ncbi:type I pullulanase [Clostridium sp. A1-XYC3]|uniref:Type I pullulanase n=1 Tax=Clostridium tanneri TaxID=3037988 RepID=A0ABU4JX60_9CLOT|nr:type I pullulanase [Clostridium sp. A1-XYC3]MDW8802749.1 type I pullulanase [Clostridium sp. A1-XYC3]